MRGDYATEMTKHQSSPASLNDKAPKQSGVKSARVQGLRLLMHAVSKQVAQLQWASMYLQSLSTISIFP